MADLLSAIKHYAQTYVSNAAKFGTNPGVAIGQGISNAIRSQVTNPQSFTRQTFTPQNIQRVSIPVQNFVQQQRPYIDYFANTAQNINPVLKSFNQPKPNSMVQFGADTPLGAYQRRDYGNILPAFDTQINRLGNYYQTDQGIEDLAMSFSGGSVKNLPKPNIKLSNLADEGKGILNTLPKEMRLQHLINYGNELLKRGYAVKQIDNISADQAATIIKNNIKPKEINFPIKINFAKPNQNFYNKQRIDEAQTIDAMQELNNQGIRGSINRVLYPIKNLTDDIKGALQQHQSARNSAKVDANMVAESFKNKLNPNLEWKLVQWSQNPTRQMAEKLKLSEKDLEAGMEMVTQSRKFNDEIFRKAKELGVDLNYLRDHIYQIFKEAPEKIDNIIAAKGLGGKPGFANRRTIESFQEGMSYGLTPKFTTFGQLNAAMNEALDKAIANKTLVENLKQSGQLLPEGQAPRSWEPITARFMPKENTMIGQGQSIQQTYFAPPDLARTLNSYLGGQAMSPADKVLNATAKVSSSMQDIVLSGGARKVNFFTFGQAYKDTVAGIGTALLGHPIRGAKIATEPWVNIARGFIPGGSKWFEGRHAQAIKEMAENGLPYSGIRSYENIAPNVAEKFHKRGGTELKKLWDSYANNPTFKEFMYQRRVSMYETLKSSFKRHGKSEAQAIKLAVDNIKSYDGMVDDLGRNSQVSDFFTTVFLAPKYREAVLNSLGNAFIKTINFKDPSGSLSRGLGLGMLVTYLGYNAMQLKLTGKPMWENPAGKELELVIPDKNDPNHYYSIPFMPGYTALPRRILGTGMALLKGDKAEAVKQFSSLYSIPISKGGELLSNRDYFGRELIDTEKPILPQIPAIAGKMFGPGIVREGINYSEAQNRYQERLNEGKSATAPNPIISLARMLELPLKEGKLSSQFYGFKDSAVKELPEEKRALYAQIYDTDESSFSTEEKLRKSMLEAQLLLANPDILEARRKTEVETAKATGEAISPFWTLTPAQQRTVLTIKSLAPGETSKSSLQSANIEWLKPYWTANSAFYDELQRKGVIGKETRDPDEYFQTTPQMRALLDQYYALPYGTGQRTAMIRSHPELDAYWDEKREFTNNQRAMLGLPLLEDKFAGGFGRKKGRKITIKLAKAPKASKLTFKLSKPKKGVLKLAKTPTFKVVKTKQAKAYKVEKIKIKTAPKNLRELTNNLFA